MALLPLQPVLLAARLTAKAATLDVGEFHLRCRFIRIARFVFFQMLNSDYGYAGTTK